MKQLLTALFIIIAISATGQTKRDTNRYFEAMYFGLDSANHLRYGTYYFATKGVFPTIEEVYKIIIDGYKLRFTYNDKNLSVILKEFNNRSEYDRFNHPR